VPKANKPQSQPEPAVEAEVPALPTVKEMEAELVALQAKKEALKKELELSNRPVIQDSTPLPSDDRLASDATEEEVARAEVLRDPYDSKITTRILRHPPGKHLNWVNPLTADHRGTMKGYVPVKREDPIGRELHRYLDEPPKRMDGLAKIDEYIRRGDLILCWIDIGIWNERQFAREREAARRVGGQAKQESYGRHGRSTDKGLEIDKKPYQERRAALGMVAPKGQEGYKAAASGTVEDSAIRVSRGRPMFEPVDDD
jgi:hypothetical protein